jgi:hypothetical protein
MTAAIRPILDAVESHAAATGRFDRVLGYDPAMPPSYEPQNAPGYGFTCAVWPGPFTMVGKMSGLNVSSLRLTVRVRLYRARTSDPLDLIDREMVEAIDTLLAAYNGDFTLGGLVMMVDLFGATGPPLSGRDGYLEEDEQVYRTYDIDLPLVLADVYEQSA